MIGLNHSTVLFRCRPGSTSLHWSQWLDAPPHPPSILCGEKIQESDSSVPWLSVLFWVLSHEGRLNASSTARPEDRLLNRSNCGEIYPDEKTDSGLVWNEENWSSHLKEFHSGFCEEKPPNKRTGMWEDGRSIRMFNQEGRFFFSFAGERRKKDKLLVGQPLWHCSLRVSHPLAYSLVSQLGLSC